MDPNETLWDILVTAQRIGQPATRGAMFDLLDKLHENVEDLRNWLNSGGFKPELTAFIERH